MVVVVVMILMTMMVVMMVISVVVMVDGGSLLEGWGFQSWPKHYVLVGQSYLGQGWGGGDLLATMFQII